MIMPRARPAGGATDEAYVMRSIDDSLVGSTCVNAAFASAIASLTYVWLVTHHHGVAGPYPPLVPPNKPSSGLIPLAPQVYVKYRRLTR
jgi:hypothetical protein